MEASKKNQQGSVSLIEPLLFLWVLAAILIVAFLVFPRVQAVKMASDEAKVLTVVSSRLDEFRERNESFVRIKESKRQFFPSTSQADPRLPLLGISGWGMPVLLESNASSFGEWKPGATYRILYTGVPQRVCRQLLLLDRGSEGLPNFLSVQVDGVKISLGLSLEDEPFEKAVAACERSEKPLMVFVGR